jgi:putative FmdB family regulatory protein
MPTYTYRCQKCGEEFERFQSMSDEPVKRCPTCKGKVQRTFHPVGIVLKGSGFHRNDYRTPSKKSGSGESQSSDTSSGSKGSDSKGSESKGSDSKGSESKSSESKSSDTKKSDSKRSSGSD